MSTKRVPCRVRHAMPSDAAEAVAVIRSSITELCVADHHNDPGTLAEWLQNKTVDHFLQWINDPKLYGVVAEFESELVGVGFIHVEGELRLCYVRPGRERLGVGKAILAALERYATERGNSEIHLSSSHNAREFYTKHGYRSTGEPQLAFGTVVDYPMAKRIVA